MFNSWPLNNSSLDLSIIVPRSYTERIPRSYLVLIIGDTLRAK